MAKEILIIEDEGYIAGLLRRNLTQKGYTVVEEECEHALQDARKHKPSLVFLDAPEQRTAASELCQHIRDTMTCPLIVLTDPSVDLEVAEGIECLPKPVDYMALVTAAENSLKQQKSTRTRSLRVLRRGDLALDLQTRLLTRGEQHYRLTPKEFLLLKLFMSKPGQVLNHKLILKEVWNTEYDGDIRTLHVHVSWLRRKIEATPQQPQRLRTVRGVGYRFEIKS